MYHLKKMLLLLLALLPAAGVLVSGQPVLDLVFQGMLNDVNGNPIGNEQFRLSLTLRDDLRQETLWNSQSLTETDEEGWFGYSIPAISRYLVSEDGIGVPVIIQMDFLSGNGTGWISAGDEFTVTYTLTPSIADGSFRVQIQRVEGTELLAHSEEHLYAFKDQYPFAYLTGGFLLTDKPPVETNAIADLRQWLFPDEQLEPGSGSRGVKGGFPVGGYRKKN